VQLLEDADGAVRAFLELADLRARVDLGVRHLDLLERREVELGERVARRAFCSRHATHG